MATTSFEQNFAVEKRMAKEFIKKMSEKVSPTLNADYKSKAVNFKEVKTFFDPSRIKK